jgi:hypothetical protein
LFLLRKWRLLDSGEHWENNAIRVNV